MKKRLPPFAAGMLTAALIGGLGLSALAASGQMTITVDPINIQVNGQTFQPKDAQGADVPVFAYNGTTYAPLRALAEAYGLEVGYDAQNNMATVGAKAGNDVQPTTTPAPDTTASAADYSDWTAEEEAAYQEFKGMWEITLFGGGVNKSGESGETYSAKYNGRLTNEDLCHTINGLKNSTEFCRRLTEELHTPGHYTYLVYSANGIALSSSHISPNGLFYAPNFSAN